MGFKDDVERWVVKTKGQTAAALRMTALEIHRRVVFKTPVDTGRARANWQITLGTSKVRVLTDTDKSGTATIAAGLAVLRAMPQPYDILIANNLPYIIPLEYGHSQQAPQGMVRTTLREMESIVGKAVREARK
jgi:hypothetical protein